MHQWFFERLASGYEGFIGAAPEYGGLTACLGLACQIVGAHQSFTEEYEAELVNEATMEQIPSILFETLPVRMCCRPTCGSALVSDCALYNRSCTVTMTRFGHKQVQRMQCRSAQHLMCSVVVFYVWVLCLHRVWWVVKPSRLRLMPWTRSHKACCR